MTVVETAMRGAAGALFGADERVLIACSGGADSTALAVAASRCGVRAVVGHVNHRLRAKSAADAEHVRALAERLALPFELAELPPFDLRELGLEGAARKARYEALARLASAAGARVVLTAHTRTDQAETVLLRLLRGAGPGALAGVRERRALGGGVEVARPFLRAVSRADTEAYCAAQGCAFLHDPHNADPRRARAAVRALWPQLLAINPRFEEALAAAAATLAEEDALLEALASPDAPHPALQRRALLREATQLGARPERVHLEQLRALLDRGGAVDVPGARLRVEPRRPAARPAGEVAIAGPGRYAWGSRELLVAAEGETAVHPVAVELPVDVNAAPLPWTLRAHRPGDRFRPAGGRRKKVGDLWTDAHVPREARPRLALLADASGEIFFVEGLRPGAAVRRGSATLFFALRPEMDVLRGSFPSCERRGESPSATVDPTPHCEE